jgi:hypothetical protein
MIQNFAQILHFASKIKLSYMNRNKNYFNDAKTHIELGYLCGFTRLVCKAILKHVFGYFGFLIFCIVLYMKKALTIIFGKKNFLNKKHLSGTYQCIFM